MSDTLVLDAEVLAKLTGLDKDKVLAYLAKVKNVSTLLSTVSEKGIVVYLPEEDGEAVQEANSFYEEWKKGMDRGLANVQQD